MLRSVGVLSQLEAKLPLVPPHYLPFPHAQYQNKNSIHEYLDHVLLPDIERRRAELMDTGDQSVFQQGYRGLLVWDHHYTHLLDSVKEKLAAADVDVAFIPKAATDHFSLLDLCFNKPAKDTMKTCFSDFITSQVKAQLEDGVRPTEVKINTSTAALKACMAGWLLEMYRELCEKSASFVENGLRKIDENIAAALQNGAAAEQQQHNDPDSGSVSDLAEDTDNENASDE